jgi:F-type H+-transporting ATPase subunit b
MTTTRKLLTITVLTAGLFIAAFAGSFFAMKIAYADHHGAHAGSGSGSAAAPTPHHEDPSKHFNFLGSPGEHYGKDHTGGPYGDGFHTDAQGNKVPGEHEMSPAFIWLVLNFVLLLIILMRFGKPAVEKLAADRHDQIKTALDEAAKLRSQAAKRLEDYESKLAKADAEIKQMIDGMRVDAEADKKRILEAAEKQAAAMKRDAEIRIAAEIENARTVLTREVTLAATAATEKLLREKMTPADQQTVVTTFISGVEAAARAGGQKEAR